MYISGFLPDRRQKPLLPSLLKLRERDYGHN